MIPLTREELSRLNGRLLSEGRNPTKADVRLVDRGGDAGGLRLVVKDFRPRSFLVRNTIGRMTIARECRAYAALGGVRGIPEFEGRIDAFAFAAGYVPGPSLRELPRGGVSSAFFDALEALLGRVHARGVALADLHHRNVLVQDPGGEPALVDFAMALLRPAAWNFPGRWLFSRALELDRVAFERIRARYEGGAHAPRGPVDVPAVWRAGRALKSVIRRLRGKP